MSSGQTINDRILAARFSIAGQGLAKSVCKATTEEINGPKKKHLDYLLHCTNEPNVSIPQLANLLIERSQNTSWVVVFKALVTVHHLMCYGNERFTQYLASSNSNFQLGNFLDKSGVAGYDMSPFIRRYAKYLNEKAIAYRTVAFDFCKVKRGKEDGTLRTMPTDKLLKMLPVLQSHLDALLEFDCSSNELTNGVINTAFMLLFRDLIRLFACYNDGIINLLEKYFDMNKKQCREALDIYKRFLVRMDRVAEFLKVAETVGVEKSDIPELSKRVGIDKGEIPDLAKAPSSLLEALEAHLGSLEGKKPNSSSTTNVSEIQAGMAALALASFAFNQVSQDTPTAFVTSSSCNPLPPSTSSAVGGANGESGSASSTGIDENLKRQALADEEAAMNQFKKNTNPFLSSPTTSNALAQTPAQAQAQTQSIVDLFAADIDAKAAQTNAPRTSDDLLQLAANPFATPPIPPLPTMAAPAPSWGMTPMQNGYGGAQPGAFATDNAFAAAFGVQTSTTTNAEGIEEGLGSMDLFNLGAAGNTTEHTTIVGHSPAPARPPAPTPSSVAHITHIPATSSNLDDFLCDWGAEPNAAVMDATPRSANPSPAHAPFANPPAGGSFAELSLENLLGSPAKKTSIANAAPMNETIPAASAANMSADFAAGLATLASNSPSNQGGKGFDAFGDLMQPNTTHSSGSSHPGVNKPNMVSAPTNSANNSGKVLTGDLDSCLASLAQNLTIQKSPQIIPANKGMQWSNSGAPGPRQQVPAQGPSPQPQQWGTPMMGGSSGMSFMTQSMPYQSAPMNMNNMSMMGNVPMRPQQMMGPQAGMMFPQQQQQPMGVSAVRPVTNSQQLDPFGAL